LAGSVTMKNERTIERISCEALGIVVPSIQRSFLPKSAPGVEGSSTTAAPSMYGWTRHWKA
jgi:hypothetical protein